MIVNGYVDRENNKNKTCALIPWVAQNFPTTFSQKLRDSLQNKQPLPVSIKRNGDKANGKLTLPNHSELEQ